MSIVDTQGHLTWDIGEMSTTSPIEPASSPGKVSVTITSPQARECPFRIQAFAPVYFVNRRDPWSREDIMDEQDTVFWQRLIACRHEKCQLWVGDSAYGDCGMKR